MSRQAHRRGLLRLLLGAAFLLLGWMLVSATPAAADDAVASTTSVVGGAAEPVTGAVESVVESPPVRIESAPIRVVETVTEPATAAVEKSVPAPVTSATETTTEVVEMTPDTVEVATSVVETAVEATPVAPVVDDAAVVVRGIVRDAASTLTVDVAEPVVETVTTVVGGVVGTVSATPPVGGVVPGVQVEVPGVTSGPSEPTTGAAVRQEERDGQAAHGIRVGRPQGSRATWAAAEALVPAGSVTERATGIRPSPLRGPAPTGPEAGTLPVPSNASSGSSAGADAASTPQGLTLPSASLLTLPHALQHPAAGPVPDPGSRPD